MQRKYRVTGTIQGVGFRPFIYRLACSLELAGYVRNEGSAVLILLQGSKENLDLFSQRIKTEAPPLAQIDGITFLDDPLEILPANNFVIKESRSGLDSDAAVPADSATCSECLEELFNPLDRRYRYPFINCTNCGPRFTIISALPYDRKQTTMRKFKMCSACECEYQAPADRRFHAQPNACQQCGPVLSFCHSQKQYAEGNEASLAAAVKALRAGAILAIKGLGGFHLACDALNVETIRELRRRKKRPAKAFAIMAETFEQLEGHCLLRQSDRQALSGHRKPIVLVEKNQASLLPAEIAPGLSELGVMMPYTPLHHILLRDFAGPLIMTSGNLSDEPIAITNEEALDRLSSIADCFLLHNRDIESRYDDSVIRSDDQEEIMLRRSRGYAPTPFPLKWQSAKNVLALGGHLKNTFTLLSGNKAYLSQHIGDMDSLDSIESFKQSCQRYERLFSFVPDIISCDLHPDYASTRIAENISESLSLPLYRVQHHHAHIVAAMAEYGLNGPVIGVAFDGAGYGSDGTIWGGEFLIAELDSYLRYAHFQEFLLPGNELAMRQPWRCLISLLSNEDTDGLAEKYKLKLSARVGEEALRAAASQIDSRFNSSFTSSCGRLFDAVASALGLRDIADYEGQAAMELESIAINYLKANLAKKRSAFSWHEALKILLEIDPYPFILNQKSSLAPKTIDSFALLRHVAVDMVSGAEAAYISTRFHRTLSRIILAVCLELRSEKSLNQVCLSGGVFQNSLLRHLCSKELTTNGFAVFVPTAVPCNDGGLSFGQALIAAASAGIIDRDALPR